MNRNGPEPTHSSPLVPECNGLGTEGLFFPVVYNDVLSTSQKKGGD